MREPVKPLVRYSLLHTKVWAKFDLHILENIGIKVKGKIHDTVVMAKLVNENRNSYKLVDLAEPLEKGIIKYELMVDSYKKSHKVVDYRNIPEVLLGAYANADVWNCMQLFISERDIITTDCLQELYDTEMQLIIPLYEMERVGMLVDKDYEVPLKDSLQKLLDETENAVYEEAGCIFNMNSSKQVYEIIEKLQPEKLHHVEMTDKGNPKLDKEQLDILANEYGVVILNKILEFRKAEKLLNVYASGIYGQRDAAYRVHGNINQTEAELLPINGKVA
jgi:DNA polymerase-1